MARILNVSGRTLDRHLAREGARFRGWAVDIRNERCQLLAEGAHPVSQSAYLLGHTDLFSRSFKKLDGMSPESCSS